MDTRRIRLCGCLLTSAALVVGPMGHAAKVAGTLERMDGDVLVSTAAGEGYQRAQPGQALKLGDRVLTLQGGRAAVVQADGCVTELAENMAFTLQTPSACEGGVSTLRQVGPYYAQAIGGEETTAPAPPDVAKKEEEPPKKKKKQYWWIAAIIVPLALLGGGGGGGSSSSTGH